MVTWGRGLGDWLAARGGGTVGYMRVIRFFRKTLIVLVAVYAAWMALGVVMVRLFRRDRKLLRFLTPYNNVTRTFAGKPGSPFALLEHVGRRSGKHYAAPLVATTYGDGLLLMLVYGPRTDWYRNVTASGSCIIHWQGKEYALERPELIEGAKAVNAWAPLLRPMLWAGGIQQYVWLHKHDESAPNVAASR